jgi:uncharacterized glyoxalase superfamily protein PhnB
MLADSQFRKRIPAAVDPAARRPTRRGAAVSPVTILLYVEDADKQFQQAVAAGCEVVMPLGGQFWGDRYGMVKDPSGDTWSIGSHMEDLTPDQIKERMGKAFGG